MCIFWVLWITDLIMIYIYLLLQPLSVWAYPKAVGEFKDSLVCSVQHNPYLVLFPISCHGVEPELKVDKKLLDFGKVLLHRLVIL